jgi:hypothetical protein
MNKRQAVLIAIIGFVAGSAAAAAAQGSIAGSYWMTGAELMREWSRTERLAYAAGAHDMLSAVLELNARGDPESAALIIAAADRCIDRRSGGTLGQFTDWAETKWRGRRDPAARILLMEACQ